VTVLGSRNGLFTIGISLLGFVLFFVNQWDELCEILAKIIAILLRETGFDVQVSNIQLILESKKFLITPECTYLDWFFVAAPFAWRRSSIYHNLCLVLMLGLSVFMFNVARVYFALSMNTLGFPWFWAHDAVDYAFWYPSLGLVIIAWLRANREGPIKTNSSQAEPSSNEGALRKQVT